jgi:hypothetical protein
MAVHALETEENNMATFRSLALLAATGLAAIVSTSIAATAEERICRTALGSITVDNLRVPQNATCTLTGTRVKGTITVQRAATLFASRVIVIGNVQGESAKRVTINRSSRIGGSVQVVQGGGAAVVNSHVNGSIQLKSNKAALRVINNIVGADVQAFGNTGGVEISDNRIDGNLQCKENVPAPTGGGNTVQGNKEDQCAGL